MNLKEITINLKVNSGGGYVILCSCCVDSTDFKSMFNTFTKLSNEITNYLYLNPKNCYVFGFFENDEKVCRLNVITDSEVERYHPRCCQACHTVGDTQILHDDLLPVFFMNFYKGE